MTTKDPIEPAFWRASAVSKRVGLPLRFLRTMEAAGTFPKSTRLSERVLVWPRAAVLAWIAERNQESTAPTSEQAVVRADFIRGDAAPRRRTRRTQPTGGAA